MESGAAPGIVDIFAKAGETMSGYMTLTTSFFNGLWENSMGQIIITGGLVSAGIGLCVYLFMRRRSIKGR